MGAYEDELTLRDLIGVLQKKKVWIWGFTLVALLLGTLYAFFLAQPVYESSAVLSVSPLKVKAQLENKIQLQQRGLLTFEGLKALAFSQANLAETLARAQKSPHWPAAWRDLSQNALLARLEGMLSLKDRTAASSTASEPPTLIAVHRVRASDPNLAAVLANAWAGVTAEMVNALPAKQLEANLRALAAQIRPAEHAYRQARDAWEKFKASDQRNAWKLELAKNEARIAEIASRLAAIPAELAIMQASLQALRAALATTPEKLSLRTALVENPLSQAAAFHLKPELAALKGLTMQNETLNPVHLSLKQKLQDLTVRVKKTEREKVALEAELKTRSTRAGELRQQVAAAEAAADRLQEDLRLARETYLALKQKQTDLKIELASIQNSLAQVLSNAYPVPEPVAPKKAMILVLSAFLGLMLGVFMAFFAAALEPPENEQSPQA